MNHFRRIFEYIKPQWKAVTLSIVCALIVASLFSLSLATMLPLMKVMIGNEGLHGWVNRAIIEQRYDLKFVMQETDLSTEKTKDVQPLLIKSANINNEESPVYEKNLKEGDLVVGVSYETPQSIEPQDRNTIMELLANAPEDNSVYILIDDRIEAPQTIEILPNAPPFYTSISDWLLSYVPKTQGPEFKRNSIILLITLMVIATIIRCFLRFVQEYTIQKVAFRTIMSLRMEAYSKSIRMPLTFFSEEGISDSMSRLVQDSNRIKVGIHTLFGKAVREPFKIVAMGVTAFCINADMTLIVLLGAPFAAVILGQIGKKMKKATKRTLEGWSKMLGHLQGSLLGIRVVKGYHNEIGEEEKFQSINDRLLKQQFRMGKVDSSSGPLLEALGICTACVGMIFAAHWLFSQDTHNLDISSFFILVVLLGSMADAGRRLGSVYPKIQTANASAERVYQLIDAPVEHDPENAIELPRLTESFEMKNLTFSYPKATYKTLDDVSLSVKAGETVAVVGPNGSGKTTLLSLIPRFFIPENGTILFDGQDIAKASLKSLREQIGIVTQQSIVFNDTIAANIAYGKPNVTMDEIVDAAKQAYAHEFIEETESKYETMVGEQGATLSGGQLQRLSIARAILRDPAVLIFDEATSQIDSDSEAKIQQALKRFAKGRTSFIIAHRLSTIIDADRIFVLDKGKLVAQGKHNELLESSPLYRTLYEMQFGGE